MPFLVVLIVCIGSTIAAGRQVPVPAAPSGQLRTHLQDERFQIVTSIRGLPLGVRDAMTALFGGALDIAESGAQFQSTNVVTNPSLPIRRLIAAGCSLDHCLVAYERGGPAHTWHVALFHWTPAATRLDAGGTVAAGMTSIEGIRRALLTGAIKAQTGGW